MKTNKEIFEELSQKYSDEELVDSVLLNEELSPEEQRKVNEEFKRIRLERLKNMSPEEIRLGRLLQMKYLLQSYFKADKFSSEYSVSKQIRRYIQLSGQSNKEIAENLDIHPTKLSRILNNKENPNIEFMYRLEEHSKGELPAHYWWRLLSLQLEHKIKTDLDKRINEAQKVKRKLAI